MRRFGASRIFLTLSAPGSSDDSAGTVQAVLSSRLEGAHQTRQARLDGGRFRVKGPKVYETIKTPDDKCAEIYRGMRSINLPT